MKKVLVTGSTGHVGNALIRELVHHRYDVKALVLPSERSHPIFRGLQDLPITVVEGDVTDPQSIDKAVAGCDAVFHLAACISLLRTPKEVDKMHQINVLGTGNIISACIKHSIKRLVHCSSISTLSDQPSTYPIDENRPLISDDFPMAYAVSKAQGERLVRQAVQNHQLDAVIIYPTGVMGPFAFQPSSSVMMVLAWATQQKEPILRNCGYDWIDVRDLVMGARLALEKGQCGDRFIFGGTWLTFEDFGRLTAKIAGVPLTKLRMNTSTLYTIATINEFLHRHLGVPLRTARSSLIPLTSHSVVSTQNAQTKLGWKARPIDDTIADTIAWARTEKII